MMTDKTLIKRLVVLQQQINALKAIAGFAGVNLPLYLDINDILTLNEADINNDGYLSAANFLTFLNKWGTLGNIATAGDFIGTLNAQPLLLRTNNLQVGSISADNLYKILFGFKGNGIGATGQYASCMGGYEPQASGNYSATLGGFQVIATGLAACAVNRNTLASGSYSFACNSSSIAAAIGAFAANNCEVRTDYGAGFGKFNEIATDANNRIFVIGNGSATNNRHNALTMLSEGNTGWYDILNPTARIHLPASLATAARGQIKLENGVSQTAAEAGVINRVDPILEYTNSSGVPQELVQAQQKRVVEQFNQNDVTLVDITGLSVNVAAGKVYKFEAILYTTSDVAGGVKAAIAGTATATNIIYEAETWQGGLGLATGTQRATALGTAVGDVTAVTTAKVKINGTIIVNAAGTLTVQFAENVATATSSVLIGSTFTLIEIA